MRVIALLVALGWSLIANAQPAPMVVKYIANNAGVREDYYLELIDTALKTTEATYGPYRLDYSQQLLSSERKHELLVAGEQLNIDRIVGFHQTVGVRAALLQVKYPLVRGFMGCRILLIRRETQAQFDRVKTLDDLRKISMGLGKGWEGYIYQSNGFNLTEPINFDILIKMLAGGRYDFVPLSAIEIEDSYSINNQPLPNLVPEKNLLIYTPLPVYFYVSPKNPELAKRLEAGFKQMDADGRINQIFDKYFSARLKKWHLSGRRIIEIPNPEDDGSVAKLDYKLLRSYD